MKERFAQLARTRVAGVPVPVLFVVAVLLLAVFIHRRRAAASNATSAQDASSLDTSTPIGAMANGGYAGQQYAYPSTAGTGGTTSADVTDDAINGLTNPNAGDTTVTGDPTGSTAAPAQLTPPKVSPAKSKHPAGHHHPKPPPTHKAAKAKAPAKKTTVHRATPTKPKPAVHKTTKAPAHHPAPAKAPKKTPPHKKPAHRGGGRRAVAG